MVVPLERWRVKISVRTFAWHDLITFYRFRNRVVITDSAQALTRGSPVGPLAFISHFNPSMGIYTCIQSSSDGPLPLVGQVQYNAGDRSARVAYLLPDEGLNQPGMVELLERLAVQAGSWGAFHLLAEAEEGSYALEGLRRSGFSVYAWQRIWKFAHDSQRATNGHIPATNGNNQDCLWRPAASVDEFAIRSLYQSLVPPLVQSAEPLTTRRLSGWVYRQDGEIMAYVEGNHGPNGIYLQPLIHPAMENTSQAVSNLLAHQRNPLGRPIYLAVRSYQAWLETVVNDLECQIGPRQALMAKHLVIEQRAAVRVGRQSVLEKYAAEPSGPMVHNATRQE